MPRIVISESGKAQQPYRFDPDHKKIKIGRGSDNDIVISCPSVSTKHCTMKRVKGGYILRDNDSTNGIKLDDSLMEVIDLSDGTEVLIGDVTMEFQLSDEEIDELEEEEFTPRQKKKLPPIKDKDRSGDKGDETPAKEKKEEGRSKKRRDEEAKKPPSPQPRHAAPPPPASPYSYRPQQSAHHGGNPLKTLLVFVLVLVAFFTGMSLRHKMRTGESLPAKLIGWLDLGKKPQQGPDSGATGQPAGDDQDDVTDEPAPEAAEEATMR